MKSVMAHQFSQAPTADIPRSSFNRSSGYKTTFDVDYLIPIFVDEVVPGDTFNMNPTLFARLNTPIYPIMDNMFLDLHWFFVPYRQIWDNFRKFCGEQVDPGDSIDYTIPTKTNVAGINVGTTYDYMGLPTGIPNTTFSALPLRAYTHIYNEWYRDQNLIDSAVLDTGDGPDTTTEPGLKKRGKRHDYFTSSLPWLQKGDAVSLPLGTTANIIYDTISGVDEDGEFVVAAPESGGADGFNSSATYGTAGTALSAGSFYNMQADLTDASAATINQLRQAFQIQKLLERDARSGTRYAEIVRSHFNVQFQDVTYRPEFLGGNSVPINVSAIPQTSNDGTNGSVGQLGAFGTANMQGGGFTKSFVEHGVVMGIASVRADLTYQQGMERYWRRSTRYDFYWPALAHIGEQAVDMGEIYYVDNTTDTDADGTVDNDEVFGYQERFAEYRYKPSKVTGLFRSTAAGTLDVWHLSEEFSTPPGLNQTFIESNTPIDRVIEVTTEPDFRLDAYFNLQCARPMPLYSIPGFIDHF